MGLQFNQVPPPRLKCITAPSGWNLAALCFGGREGLLFFFNHHRVKFRKGERVVEGDFVHG